MKVRCEEWKGCFSFELTPESLEDMALLVRLGMNATSELRSCGTDVPAEGPASGNIVIGKRRQPGERVPRVRR